MGVAILGAAWCGGGLVAANIAVESLPFSVLLVQPHLIPSADEPFRPWLTLDQMTRAALSGANAVDLVVWPETCLSESWCNEPPPETDSIDQRLTLHDYARMLTPFYATNSLVGAVVAEVGTTKRYGLDVTEVRRYNCGCLVSTQGEIARHEKCDLVPLKEGLPRALNFDWMREHVLPMLKLNPTLSYGRDFRPLSFRDRRGVRRTIAVSVCYESLLPWLPQYRDSPEVDAIIHLVYDGHSVGYPGVMQRLIRACQSRAIETRKWNLVCSTWSGSAIIDPSGRIVRQLSAVADSRSSSCWS
jgi:apolipoprotein N-acyltransferase